MEERSVVVPGYYLVCYNSYIEKVVREYVVVPGYYLVCYNYISSCTSIF